MIKLAEDTISAQELELAAKFMVSGRRLTKGEVTLEFEQKFSETVGSKYSVFVNSGSSANLLVAAALKESGKLKNNIVVCPAISWVTTVTPFTQLGFEVILCDAEINSLGVSIDQLEKLFLEKNPSVLVLVHVLGHPNQIDKILELCERYEVILIEDSCEALGTQFIPDEWLGTFGLAGTFSFYYGHHISTIEGGMVVTDDFDFYQLMLSLRSHGWSRDLDETVRTKLTQLYQTDSFRNLYTFYYPGFNFRSTDLQAFIGIGQLDKLKDIINTRKSNFETYSTYLSRFWFQTSENYLLSSFAFGITLENRSEVSEILFKNGIESRPLICGNIGKHPFWLRENAPKYLPIADWIHDKGMYLPNHANLSAEDIQKICLTFDKYAIPSFPE